MDLCQGEGLLMLCLFRGDSVKNSEPKIRSCFFIFVDLEKAFDWVSREVIHFASRQKDVPEYLVNEVMSLCYKGCKTAVSVDGEQSSSFFCESWCPPQVCFESTLIYHGNRCSNRRCEGWFINEVAVCRQSCFVWGIIK